MTAAVIFGVGVTVMPHRLLILAAALAAPLSSESRDLNEVNLVRAIHLQSDPEKKLQILRRWQQRYPRSAYRQERYDLTIRAEQALGRSGEMWNTARRMFRDNPSGAGAYWLAATGVATRQQSPAALREMEHAASRLVSRETHGALQETAAHRALGWVAMCKNHWTTAITEFKIVLLRDASDAEASYWIAVSLEAQRQPDQALFHLARALVVTGPGALPTTEQQRIRDQLERRWTVRFGSHAGLDRLYSKARSGPLEPL